MFGKRGNLFLIEEHPVLALVMFLTWGTLAQIDF